MASRINPLISNFLHLRRSRPDAGQPSPTTNRLAKLVERYRPGSDSEGPLFPNELALQPGTRPLYASNVYHSSLEELPTFAAAFVNELDEEHITRLIDQPKDRT
jgi:hypothetical protein